MATNSAGLFRISVFAMGYPLSLKTRRFMKRGVRSAFASANGGKHKQKRPKSLSDWAANFLGFV
jgi:hypothetical protein